MNPLPAPSRGERGASLGLSASNSAELIQQVERGFSFKTLHTLESRSGLPGAALAGLVGIPERTLARRKSKGKFTPEELAQYYKFQVVPDKDYIERIQATHKKFARIYPLYDADIKYEVRGYTFPFTLYAPQPVQQFVYEHGLGHFSYKGFGMLDVAHHNAIKKANSVEMNYASVDLPE